MENGKVLSLDAHRAARAVIEHRFTRALRESLELFRRAWWLEDAGDAVGAEVRACWDRSFDLLVEFVRREHDNWLRRFTLAGARR